jgi:1-acyl-sn-glycerol-3-phosphate acyltransferase
VSFQIPSAKVAASILKISYKFWSGTRDILKITYRDRMVFLSVLAISWFWFLGSIILSQFPAFAQNVLQGDDQVATLLLATFSVGIGIGSLLCSWLSSGRVEIGLMPIGAVGMAVFTWMLGETALPPADQLRTLAELAVTPGIVAVIINMIMIAISAGLFLVPLYAFMQIRTDEADRSRVIAANNIINAIFMITAGIMAAGMLLLGYDVLDIFKVTAVLTAIVTVYIMWMVPEFVLRFVAWLLIHSIYRVEKVDLHNVPEEGGALIVCNHVSFIDPMILHALLPRPARYVMYEPFYRMPVMNWLFRGMKSIPINTKKADEVVFTNAFNEIAECLEKGRLVVLFPEGGITRDGEIAKFQPGIDQILKRTPVPVVPIALRGVWGTWFSRHKGSAMKGLPTSWMRRISVISGESVPPEEANRLSMHEKVIALRGEQQ